jgi:hypothetical protein
MSLEKLIKTLAKTVNTRTEMRDMEDRPIQCQCCVIRMTNADGTSSEFWYHATNNGAAGYSCAFSIFGGPQSHSCNECGRLY